MSTWLRIAASLGAPLLFLSAGVGIAALVPALRRKALLRRLPWAYLLGLAWSGCSLYALSHWGKVSLRRGTILPVVLLPVVAGTIRSFLRPREPAEIRQRRSRTAHAACFFAALAGSAVSIAVLAHALSGVESGWDPDMTWNPLARYVRAARSVDAPVLLDGAYYVTHPRYPLLMPLLQAASQEVFDTPYDERVPRALYAALLPAFLLLVFDGIVGLAGPVIAGLVVLVASLVPLFSFLIDGGAITSYSDLPLGLFWGAALLLLLRGPWSVPEACAAGLLLAAAALTKTEGVPLALIAAGLALLRGARRVLRSRGSSRPRAGWLRSAAALHALVVLALALFFSWRSGIPDRFSEGYGDATPTSVVVGTIARLPLVLPPIGREMRDLPTWQHFWWLGAFVALLGIRSFARPPARFLGLAVLGGLGLYFASYGATVWDPAVLVHPTWNRFLLQLSVPLLILFGMCLDRALSLSAGAARRSTGARAGTSGG
jgi:hypothetical protein